MTKIEFQRLKGVIWALGIKEMTYQEYGIIVNMVMAFGEGFYYFGNYGFRAFQHSGKLDFTLIGHVEVISERSDLVDFFSLIEKNDCPMISTIMERYYFTGSNMMEKYGWYL